MTRSVLKYELIGIAFISILGGALNFAFEWSDRVRLIGIISTVNESVFERLKLTYWPTLLYAAITYGYLKKQTGNFLVAKAASVYVMPSAIIALSYSYRGITGSESLIVDIIFFVIAVALGQLTSYRILIKDRLPQAFWALAMVGLVGLGGVYIRFTYFPPHLPLFKSLVKT